MEKITRQEVLFLHEALSSLPTDVKDFEYHLCLIENTDRLTSAVTKIKDALRAAANPVFITKSTELSEKASKIATEKGLTDWYEAMAVATSELPEEEKSEYLELQKVQSDLEKTFLAEPSDIELYKLEKSKLPAGLPLDLRQSVIMRYFLK